VVEWLFLNWIDTEAGAFAIGVQNHAMVLDLANETKAAISFLHPTLARAQITYDPLRSIRVRFQINMPPFSEHPQLILP
jgi:hypothetical protein